MIVKLPGPCSAYFWLSNSCIPAVVTDEADWLIDLGPEGGDGGGKVVVQGAPEYCARAKYSHTAGYLKPFLRDRSS